MDTIERVKERLDNVKGIRPLIAALRTISAGAWNQARSRRRASEGYSRYLGEVLAATLPHIGTKELGRFDILAADPSPRRALMLVIASETGLCGAYNDTVLAGAEQIMDRQRMQSDQVLVATLGMRATRYFRSQEREVFASVPLPITRVPSLDMVRKLAMSLREAFENNEVDAIYVIYSPARAGQIASPIVERWLPIGRDMLPSESVSWPEPVIETDPGDLFRRTLGEWALTRLYHFVIEAATSEHSARYRAMEAASDNLESLVDELTLEYHTQRQHAITMEMLDLVAGSDILAQPKGGTAT